MCAFICVLDLCIWYYEDKFVGWKSRGGLIVFCLGVYILMLKSCCAVGNHDSMIIKCPRIYHIIIEWVVKITQIEKGGHWCEGGCGTAGICIVKGRARGNYMILMEEKRVVRGESIHEIRDELLCMCFVV